MRIDLDDGDVGGRIRADELRPVADLVLHDDFNAVLARIVHDMVIGCDVAVAGDDDSRARSLFRMGFWILIPGSEEMEKIPRHILLRFFSCRRHVDGNDGRGDRLCHRDEIVAHRFQAPVADDRSGPAEFDIAPPVANPSPTPPLKFDTSTAPNTMPP